MPVRSDLVGLAIAGAFAGWVLVSAQTTGGDPADYLATLGVFVGAYAVGRLTGRWAWAIAAVVATAFGAWILTTDGALDGGPLAGPLGYANANAALAVQVAAVLLVAATRTTPMTGRLLLAAASVPVLSVAWFNESWAALGGGAVLFAAGLVVLLVSPRSGRLLVLACGLLVAVAVAGQATVALGVGGDAAARAVSERRVDLWSDAADLARSEPLTGHGPQSFATASPTAASDTDTQAAHSAVLEVAAETGLVGAALLLLLVAWAFWSLALTQAGPAIVGAVGWAAFCLHTLVDYVADYPLVVGAAALSLGLAVGPYQDRRRAGGSHRRQNSSMSPNVSDQPASSGG